MSLRVSMSTPLNSACSGLMYAGVPMNCSNGGEEGLVGQPALASPWRCRSRSPSAPAPVVHGDQDVRRFEVAVDDAFLMGVLDGLADLR